MKYAASLCLLIAVASVAAAQRAGMAQTMAPQELRASVAPPAIAWDTPELPGGPIKFESAEERHLRLVVLTNDLEQPWSTAFLPDGSMLVTERRGRIRLIRNGKLRNDPVEGVPRVQPGGEGNLQGLMDIALHPRFSENRWVYSCVSQAGARRRGCDNPCERDVERQRAC